MANTDRFFTINLGPQPLPNLAGIAEETGGRSIHVPDDARMATRLLQFWREDIAKPIIQLKKVEFSGELHGRVLYSPFDFNVDRELESNTVYIYDKTTLFFILNITEAQFNTITEPIKVTKTFNIEGTEYTDTQEIVPARIQLPNDQGPVDSSQVNCSK